MAAAETSMRPIHFQILGVIVALNMNAMSKKHVKKLAVEIVAMLEKHDQPVIREQESLPRDCWINELTHILEITEMRENRYCRINRSQIIRDWETILRVWMENKICM